jgi:hypothetical protein
MFLLLSKRTWAPEFVLLGGYDQEPGIMPSSQQDVDLKNRAWYAAQGQIANQSVWKSSVQMRGAALGCFNIKIRDATVHEIQLQKATSFIVCQLL